ncbi:hypothetical protein [Serratia sp. UGAL515B_01]|uniref:hypothetical protein n=1 Tax=Serratia sp. UGAL515B_01 TaxID=2986763 RepID=UPI0029554B48|nr:hypothetical protein [Serratia sp. UGAL515B_01]WON77797.1 hypothetical protein OK023_03675 [Serratia sp. UGAL515B_01]
MNITLSNGRIDLENLNGIANHLRALSITNKTLDNLKEQLSASEDKNSDWYRRTTVAHKSWFWMRCRICERLSILRQEEKELNKMRARFEDEELLKLLRKEVTKSELQVIQTIARAKATQRLEIILNESCSSGEER